LETSAELTSRPNKLTFQARTLRLGYTYLGPLLALLIFPCVAFAALGGDVNSVQGDVAHLKGALRVTNATAYAVHEIRTSSGTVVKEYVSPQGKVFAVAWHGPFLPDLQQVLGPYFARVQMQTQGARRGRGPLVIQQPDLVVQSTGHMRSFQGKAYLPELLPEGVSADAIH
jgi:Protein of unknown function (DUF2844)